MLRAKHPHVRIVAVEPEKSAVLSGGKPGEHRIDGIGAGFVPQILDRAVITDVRTISEADAQKTKLELARREGLLVGISAGASVKIALDIARELGPGKTVVTILCDSGNRYQSKLFNPEFMRSKNLPVPEWLEKRSKIDVPFEKA